jgi:nucleoside-diphosphate-sugar epimerase
MAAQSVVRHYEDRSGLPSNAMGTVHLLEAVRQLGRPCAVVNVTTDKCRKKGVGLKLSGKRFSWGHDPLVRTACLRETRHIGLL